MLLKLMEHTHKWSKTLHCNFTLPFPQDNKKNENPNISHIVEYSYNAFKNQLMVDNSYNALKNHGAYLLIDGQQLSTARLQCFSHSMALQMERQIFHLRLKTQTML